MYLTMLFVQFILCVYNIILYMVDFRVDRFNVIYIALARCTDIVY